MESAFLFEKKTEILTVVFRGLPGQDCIDMQISVIMPVYNAEKYLAEAIRSILTQTYHDFELIIGDDGSSDGSRKVIEQFAKSDSRIVVIGSQVNLGKTATVNRLFKLSTGRFVTIHDADDVSHPLRFERQMNALNQDSELALCGTSFITVDEKGFFIEETKMPADYKTILNQIENRSQFHGPTMMIRRSVLEELGEIYRPYFRDNYEDTDLAYRVIEKYKGRNLSESLYVYRIVETSLCRKDVDVRNRNLYKVVVHLAQQRKNKGKDALMENRSDEADSFLEGVTSHYKNDPSLIYREAAAYYFYWKLYRKAVEAAWKGLIKRPLNLINLRTLLYILRKKLINIFHGKIVKKHYQEILRKNF